MVVIDCISGVVRDRLDSIFDPICVLLVDEAETAVLAKKEADSPAAEEDSNIGTDDAIDPDAIGASSVLVPKDPRVIS